MSNGMKTAKDGTLITTLGKKLVKSAKFTASELREPVLFADTCKELSFARVNGDISLFINKLDEDHRLTIDDKCSMEADIKVAWLQVNEDVEDDKEFEIWVWK